jgi:hypothetical protein
VHEDGAEAATLAVGAATSGAGTDIFSDDLAAADATTDGDGAVSTAAAAGVATGDAAAGNGMPAGEASASNGDRTDVDAAIRRPG